MKLFLLSLSISIHSTMVFAQHFDRGGEEPASPPSVGLSISIVIIGLIILWIKAGKDLKKRKIAFTTLAVEEKNTIKFGRYAIKSNTRLEYPIAYINKNQLVIISKEEADKTAEFKQKIEIPLNEIRTIEITKAKDPYSSSKGVGFTGSLTITEINCQITEFVFNDDSKNEIKRFTELKRKLINEINTAKS